MQPPTCIPQGRALRVIQSVLRSLVQLESLGSSAALGWLTLGHLASIALQRILPSQRTVEEPPPAVLLPREVVRMAAKPLGLDVSSV